MRDYARPVLMTLFNGEFNGSWWYGVSPRANYALTTEGFVTAWRRVVDIFRAVGADNVSWAWVVNSYPSGVPRPEIDSNIGAYYPGDGYVDWVGADVYDVGTPTWLDEPYAFAVAHGKPVFIGEFGVRHEWSGLATIQQRAWLAAMFDYFESHPAIKAVSYFNFNNRAGGTRVPWDPSRAVYLLDGRVNYVPDVNDHDSRLLAGGPALQALFASRIGSPRYLSSISTEQVEIRPAVATVSLLVPRLRGATVIVRWKGNFAAATYDLALRRPRSAWHIVRELVTTTSRTLTVRTGDHLLVRVRARDVDGRPGAWSSARRVGRN